MNWRVAVALAVVAGLALGFAPAYSQAGNGAPSAYASVSLFHYYRLSPLGFGVINDTFTFKNNGTSPVQIPTLQVGLPAKISARTLALALNPTTQFSLSQSQVSGNTSVTITPNQATLNAGANVTVALDAIVTDIMNYTSTGFSTQDPLLVMLSPSLNVNVTKLDANVLLPAGGEFLTYPPGFSLSPTNGSYFRIRSGVAPKAAETYLNFNATAQGVFTPITVTSLVRTIVPAANGFPMVKDQFTIHNLASFNVTQIHLNLLNPGTESVTEQPSTVPPLLNPRSISLTDGNLAVAAANFGSPLSKLSNLTATITYPAPASAVVVSGGTVKVTVPYSPLIGVPVSNYSIMLASAKGVVPSGRTSYLDQSVTPLTTGSVQFTYTVSVGWAADQAIPAGILVFAVAFAMFAIQKPSMKKAEGEKAVRKTSDVLRAFEEKTGLETQYLGEFATAPKGSITKADFDRMKNEVSELRSRAIQRLSEMKQVLGSGRQYDALTRVADGEKEEDRAFRDILNLYMQYHGNRMNEETFRRLLPNYKKRVDSAINHLSDLLHETQTEEK